MKKFWVGILIILVAVFGFVVWYSTSQKTESPTTGQPLKIGLNPWIGHGLYYVAKEKGFFEKEKVNVELTNFNNFRLKPKVVKTRKKSLKLKIWKFFMKSAML